MHLPFATHRNAQALTLFNILLFVLLAILRRFFLFDGGDPSFMQDLQDKVTTAGASLGILIFVWIFFAGLVVLGVYLFFIPHRSYLKKPEGSFLTFYYVTMLWIGLFLTANFFSLFLLPVVGTLVSESVAIIISALLTDVVNIGGVYCMYYYLASGSQTAPGERSLSRSAQFIRWCARVVYKENPYVVRNFFLIGVAGYIGFFPLFTLVSVLVYALFTQFGISLPIQPIVEFSLRNNGSIVAIFLFISVVLTAPLLEEFIMRGLIFRALLKRFSPFVAILFSGFVFGAFHFNLFSFFQISVFGMFLSWMYFATGSLLPGMVAHAFFNGINFVGLRFLR